MVLFIVNFHIVSECSGLYFGVSADQSVVTQAISCPNEDSLLWHWQGSHLVNRGGDVLSVSKFKQGKVLVSTYP